MRAPKAVLLDPYILARTFDMLICCSEQHPLFLSGQFVLLEMPFCGVAFDLHAERSYLF